MPSRSWSIGADPTPPQTTPAIAFNSDAYARQLRHLFPPGVALDLVDDSELSKLCRALADELARVDARGKDLINEGDPRSADQTIEQWEEMVGLPDDRVTVIPATLAERRIAVTQKYGNRGGQNVSFFVQLAALCGYTVAAGFLAPPAALSGSATSTGGTLASATYAYRVTAVNERGETDAQGVEVDANTGTGTNRIALNWAAVPTATAYKVYRSNGVGFRFLSKVTGTSFNDTGAIALGATEPPSTNTASFDAVELYTSRLLRAGFRASARVYGIAYAYAMRVHVTAVAPAALQQSAFERVIRRAAHSHVQVLFAYH